MKSLHNNKFREKYHIVEKLPDEYPNLSHIQAFKVRDLRHGRIFIMKKVCTTLKNHKQFVREAQIATNIQHDNLIKCYDFEIKKDSVTVIMEYYPTTLSDFLQDAIYPLSKQNICAIIYMISKALVELHNNHIVHRNLNPSNIVLSDTNIIKVKTFCYCSIENNLKVVKKNKNITEEQPVEKSGVLDYVDARYTAPEFL